MSQTASKPGPAPLTPTRGAGQSYSGPHWFPLNGMAGLTAH